MGHNHSHAPSLSAASRHRRPLRIAFALTLVYALVEVVSGLLLGSLALLSDAGHMLTDVVGLGMALAAVQLASQARDPGHTYGLYRLEVLAALANAVLLFGVAGYVLYEAAVRFSEPPDVPGLPLLVVAGLGLAVNLVSFLLLRAGAKESLNVRGAFLEVFSDMLGSAGVIVAGVVLVTTGWPYVDPIVGVGIGLFILPRAWRLGRDALRILLEIAPADVDVTAAQEALARVPGVHDVHDLHVWTLTSGMNMASGHLSVEHAGDVGPVLQAAHALLAHEYDVTHATLQVEPKDLGLECAVCPSSPVTAADGGQPVTAADASRAATDAAASAAATGAFSATADGSHEAAEDAPPGPTTDASSVATHASTGATAAVASAAQADRGRRVDPGT